MLSDLWFCLLSLMFLAAPGSKCSFSSHNFEALLRVKNSPNSFSFNKMICVAVFTGDTIKEIFKVSTRFSGIGC